MSDPPVPEQSNVWMKVFPEETVPFTFGGRGKVRHRDTHAVRIHQLAVRMEMWEPITPVSVDKVGVYFRQASPASNNKVCVFTCLSPFTVFSLLYLYLFFFIYSLVYLP